MNMKATINVYETTWGEAPGFPAWHQRHLAAGRTMGELEKVFAHRGNDITYVVTRAMNTTDPRIGAELTTEEVDVLIKLGTTVNISPKPSC